MSKHGLTNPVMPREANLARFGGFVGVIGETLKSVVDPLQNHWRQSLEESRRAAEINRAIEHLQRLTDAQLRDMGIARADISDVVRNGRP